MQVISDSRAPLLYMVSSNASSRRPIHVDRSGAVSTASISSRVRYSTGRLSVRFFGMASTRPTTPMLPGSRIFNADTLALVKPTAIIINTSRGPLIDEAALVEALQHNRIGGAGLDVYEAEPLPADSPLRSLDNVLLSPHVSGMDKMAKRKVTERCVSNILKFLSGQKDAIRAYTVNPETLMENSK
jgi:hypothetical protein